MKCLVCGNIYDESLWFLCPVCRLPSGTKLEDVKFKEVKNMEQKTLEPKVEVQPVRKALPKFSSKVRISQYGALQVTVFIPRKYIEKVLQS